MDGTLGLYETNFLISFWNFCVVPSVDVCSVGSPWVEKNGRVRANEERPIVKFVAIFSGRYNFFAVASGGGREKF